MHRIEEINHFSLNEFKSVFGGVYESSPWVANAVFKKAPFENRKKLIESFKDTVDEASKEQKKTLILAHPDLGGKLAKSGKLTKESTQEQSRLGLDRLDEQSYNTINAMNDAYKEKFGFPFILCVGLIKSQKELLDDFQKRLENNRKKEEQTAIDQIHLIARLRLKQIVLPNKQSLSK